MQSDMPTPALLPPDEAYLGLDGAAADLEAARAVIIPFGLEATVSYGGGTAEGPAAILAASQETELFDEEYWFEPCHQYGVATLAPVP
ncbi:MAG: arginase family protein, partial [Myxococcales bacterium]|nr:arginase family protein [Myxococcales bacterium]